MPGTKIASTVVHWPRPVKRAVALCTDAALCVLATLLAFYLRMGELQAFRGPVGWASFLSVAIALPLFISFGLYRAIFRYSGLPSLLAVGKAIGLYAFFYATIFAVLGAAGVPRTIGLIQPILLIVFVGASRIGVRIWLGGLYQRLLRKSMQVQRVLIYGAGDAGRQTAAALGNSAETEVLGYLDDDDRLHGQVLNGLRIYSPARLPQLIERKGITNVLLALPSVPRKRRNDIIQGLAHLHVEVRTLPGLADLTSGRVTLSDIQELDLDDLLGRDPVQPNGLLLNRHIRGKTVMVTGAGGSIGSELCRQIMLCRPARLLLVELSEFAIYTIHQELLNTASPDAPTELVPLLANVADAERMNAIMLSFRPQTVYHAAAYKHVPLVEQNPTEGLRNNVWGTMVCAQAAQHCGVAQFVLISTDKAVRPTNIMGASKRLAEMVLQALQADQSHTTQFSMVRFGNVLGSSGSVVPLFREQIAAGGPITLTHADITRYFMTIPEAAQLVIQAGAMAAGGDVFVLDMGEPVRIRDLACRMVELSGQAIKDATNPNGDIEIVITGLRPGEKLYEELLIGDNPQATQHPRILKAHENFVSWPELHKNLEALKQAMACNDLQNVRLTLKQLVSGYSPEAEIVDWVWVETREYA